MAILKNRFVCSGGAAYVELTLSLGVAIPLFLTSIDLGLMIDSRTRMSVQARETGNDGFRSCWTDSDPENCLRAVRSRSIQSARTVGLAINPLPDAVDADGNIILREEDFEVILSLYNCATYTCAGACAPSATEAEELSDPCRCNCSDIEFHTVPGPGASNPDLPTRYDLPRVSTDLISTMHKQSKILVTEVILRNHGMTTLTDKQVLYEESIF